MTFYCLQSALTLYNSEKQQVCYTLLDGKLMGEYKGIKIDYIQINITNLTLVSHDDLQLTVWTEYLEL